MLRMSRREQHLYLLSWLALGTALLSLVSAVVAWHSAPRIVIPQRHDHAVMAQVFFDMGHGIRAEDVATVHVPRSEKLRDVVFPMPRAPLRSLRFDPTVSPGNFEIGAPRYETRNGKVLHRFSLDDVHPLHQIAESRKEGDRWMLRTTPDAHDPMITLSLAAPLQPESRPWPWIRLVIAAVLGGAFFGARVRYAAADRRVAGWVGARLGSLSIRSPYLGMGAIAALQLWVAWPLHRVLDLPTYDEVNFAALGANWQPFTHLGQFHNSPLYAMSYAGLTRLTGDIGEAIFLQHYVLKLGLAVLLFLLLSHWWRNRLAAFCATALWVLAAYNFEQPYLVYHAGLLVFLGALVCIDRWPLAGIALTVVAGCIRQDYILAAIVAFGALAMLTWRGVWSWREWIAVEGASRRWGIGGLVTAGVLVGVVVGCTKIEGSSARMWYAFQQHYAHRAVLRGEATAPLNPWVDYDVLIRRDFSEARSLGEAVQNNRSAVVGHVIANFLDVPKEFSGLWRRYHTASLLAVGALVGAAVVSFLRRDKTRASTERLGARNRLSGWLALGGLAATIPGLLISVRDAYLLPAIPAVLLAGGLVMQACCRRLAGGFGRWPGALAWSAASVALVAVLRSWPMLAEGSHNRGVAETVKYLQTLWREDSPRTLLGVEATSYGHYLGAHRCRGVELLDTVYGQALAPGYTLALQIEKDAADAVLVTPQWRQSSRFDPAELERLANDPDWTSHDVPVGQLFVKRRGGPDTP